jgi:hypothetical protein
MKINGRRLFGLVARVAQLDRASVYGTDAENSQVPENVSTCADGEPCDCHNLCQTLAENPDLAALVDAWPTLPEPIKAGILAMVKASTKS